MSMSGLRLSYFILRNNGYKNKDFEIQAFDKALTQRSCECDTYFSPFIYNEEKTYIAIFDTQYPLYSPINEENWCG